MDRQRTHEDLEAKARPAASRTGSVLRPARRLPARHARHGAALPRRRARLSRAHPAKVTATQLLYRSTDMNGRPACRRHHGDGARRARLQPAVSDPVLPMRDRRRGRPLLPVVCAAAGRQGRRALAQIEFLLVAAALAEGWAVSVPDHEGTRRHLGRPARTRLPHARRSARSAELRSTRPVRGRAHRPVGLLRRRTRHGLGSRDVRGLRARTQRRRRRARLTRRRPRATPSGGSTAASTRGCPRSWSPRCRTCIPISTASSPNTPPPKARAMLQRIEKMTTAHAVLQMIGKDMDDIVD